MSNTGANANERMNTRPVIGITANYAEQNSRLAEGYYRQVTEAGGTPVIIPPINDEGAIISTLDTIDGLLLSGGADINPLLCGEEPRPCLGAINATRDIPELLLTRLAMQRQLPILGICRGIQTLAVAMGGRVAQDISELHLANTLKHSQEADRNVATHSITIEHGSLLSSIYEGSVCCDSVATIKAKASEHLKYVNSFHHQAVSDPGPRLRVSAKAADGVIEAVESTEHKPIVGVQWHPECMGAEGLPLFQWLVAEASLMRQTRRLHSDIITLDTHCDTPMLFPQGIDFAQRDPRLLVDLPKMNDGLLDATIMVAYLPQSLSTLTSQHSPREYADNIFNQIRQMAERNKECLALARTPDDLLRNKRSGRKSIMLGIENGLALEGDPKNVEYFVRQGIVYITLCHNGDNDICDSARGDATHGGLSKIGEQVVREMNRLGLMVDLSHAHERSFYDALELSSTPIVCSHSSARALCDHPRNLTDDQMKALAKRGGVCQITLYHGFLRSNGEATIIDAMNHLEHAIKVMGIEHVGLGSDFDGDGGVTGLADASELTLFTRQMLRRRFNPDDIAAIWGGNFLRVMKQCQQIAS